MATPTDLAQTPKTKSPFNADEFLKFYLGPLILLISSIALILAAVLPLLDTTFRNIEEISKLQGDYDSLLSNRSNRQELSKVTNDQQATLALINKLIPQAQTAVVDFSENIRTKAQQNALKLNESKVGELVTVTNDATDTTASDPNAASLELVELPAEFSLTGKLASIRNFLSSLYSGNDFIIIKEMKLAQSISDDPNQDEKDKYKKPNSADWSMEIVLVKYQFRIKGSNAADALKTYYFSVPDSARANQDVVNFINQNYGSD